MRRIVVKLAWAYVPMSGKQSQATELVAREDDVVDSIRFARGQRLGSFVQNTGLNIRYGFQQQTQRLKTWIFR